MQKPHFSRSRVSLARHPSGCAPPSLLKHFLSSVVHHCFSRRYFRDRFFDFHVGSIFAFVFSQKKFRAPLARGILLFKECKHFRAGFSQIELFRYFLILYVFSHLSVSCSLIWPIVPVSPDPLNCSRSAVRIWSCVGCTAAGAGEAVAAGGAPAADPDCFWRQRRNGLIPCCPIITAVLRAAALPLRRT